MPKTKTISVTIIAAILICMFAVFGSLQVNAKSHSGYLKVKAVSKNIYTQKSGQYSFKDTTFKIYKKNKKTVVATVVTNKNGKASKIKLPTGKYYVKEKTIPDTSGYYKNKKWNKIIVKSKKTRTSKIKHNFKKASLKIYCKKNETIVISHICNKESVDETHINTENGYIHLKKIIAGEYVLWPYKDHFKVKPGETKTLNYVK